MEISIERSPQHWCPSAVSNSQPLDPEFDALDHSATGHSFKYNHDLDHETLIVNSAISTEETNLG